MDKNYSIEINYERKLGMSILHVSHKNGKNIEPDGKHTGLWLFSGVRLKDYPIFLENSLNEINMGYTDTSGISFGFIEANEFDGLPEIPNSIVELGSYCGGTRLSFSEFYTLCLLDFGQKYNGVQNDYKNFIYFLHF